MKLDNYNYYNFNENLKKYLNLPINQKYTISFIVKHIMLNSLKKKNKYILSNGIINLCKNKYSKSGYKFNYLFKTAGYWSINLKKGFTIYSIRELASSFIGSNNEIDIGNNVKQLII